MKLYYATTRKAKVISLQDTLKDCNVTIVQVPLEMPEPRSSDVEEIARQKVRFAYDHIKKPTVALDAGFYIPAWNGFPRAFVNFSLETLGLRGILKLMEGEDRSCEFRHSLGYLDSTLQQPVCFTDRVDGVMAYAPQGSMENPDGTKKDYLWSVLSMLFIPQGETQTLAEMERDYYMQWKSHRKNAAAKQFAGWLKDQEGYAWIEENILK